MTINLDQPVEALTPRELEVLRLMAQGLPNRKIADQLQVNERTIKHHVSEILSRSAWVSTTNQYAGHYVCGHT